MYTNKYQVMADALRAEQLLAELANSQQSGVRYLERDMEAAKVKVDFRPDYKAVLQATASLNKETMADFVREATNERIVRVLNAKIAAEKELAKEAA